MGMGDATARRLVWVSFAGQVLFTIGWIAGGAAEPGYSQLRDALAALGARDAAHPWIFLTGAVALAVAIFVLGPAVGRAVPSRQRLVAASFAVAGVGTLAWAGFRPDCDPGSQACRDRFDAGLLSWQHSAHLWAGLAMSVAILATALAVAAALWPRPIAVVALGSGVTGLAISVGSWFAWGHGANGLVDRVGVLAMHVWLVGAGIGVLYATRRSPAPPPPTPLRPRDFFGRDWTGEGEFTLRPLWLWRGRPQRFTFGRTATWLSDEAWTFEDRASFANGWSERRIRFCRFESPREVSVISEDLLGGATVLFDDDGYRILPFRMLLPFGPLPLSVRCRDSAVIDDDGMLIETIEASFAGIPVARAVLRARTVPRAGSEQAHVPVALPG
jgi:hypothetical protein